MGFEQTRREDLMRIARPVLAILIAAAVGGCGHGNQSTPPAATGATSPAGVVLRTQEPQSAGTAQICMQALTEGTIVRDERSGLALRGAQGGVGEVIWPNGYSARDDGGRPVLLDASGNVVAHEGDHVSIGGGIDAEGAWLACGGPKVVAP